MTFLGIAPTTQDLAAKFIKPIMKTELTRKKDFVRIANGVSIAVVGHFIGIAPIAIAINASESVSRLCPIKQSAITALVHVCNSSAASLNNCFAFKF